MNNGSGFVETLEYRRFVEFCDACRRYRYIGLCYGAPGIGKTLSAWRYSRAENIGRIDHWNFESVDGLPINTVFYTAAVVNTPARIEADLTRARETLSGIATRPIRREAREALDAIRFRDDAYRAEWEKREPYISLPLVLPLEPRYLEVFENFQAKERAMPNPTTLVLIDEADRLRMASLEQIRADFDRQDAGLILIGMPGIEKRMARYPQFCSRIGFVHEFRPLGAEQMRELLEQGWAPAGIHLPDAIPAPETIAAVIRITGGNFRLLNRLLTQIERILEINGLEEISNAVVEAARESLVTPENDSNEILTQVLMFGRLIVRSRRTEVLPMLRRLAISLFDKPSPNNDLIS